MASIHAIILTLNEEPHIARCIESIRDQCASVTVVDSGSIDQTVKIAEGLGARAIRNPWINYASQMNFGIRAVQKCGGWLLRIDADEIFDQESRETLVEAIRKAGEEVDGILVQRRIYFLGRRMKHGGIEPSWQLRLWRNGKGRCEQRWMDEHIKVDGAVIESGVVLSDANLNSLSWWTAKHNTYASREAIDVLNRTHHFLPHDRLSEGGASSQARLRRLVKERIYANLSPGHRAALYFLYRYVVRLGFLDGAPGYYFHLLQGLWYRTLVDAKIAEISVYADVKDLPIVEAIRERTGIDVMPANGQMNNEMSGEVKNDSPPGVK